MDQTKNYIRALEEEQNGNWSLAHGIIQEIDTEEAAWIHAYLHRVEGELGNAAYWYRRAGRPECTSTFKAEWTEIMETVQR
jgi:hypothetical protein